MSTTDDQVRPYDEHADRLSSQAGNGFANPGLPPHVPRRSDVDPAAAKRAEHQVAALFILSVLGTIGFIVAYYAMEPGQRGYVLGIGEVDLYHVVLGVTMAVSLLGIGLGAIHWAKTLMSDEEQVEERHPQAGTPEERTHAAGILSYGWRSSQLNRRPLLLATMGGALGLFALPMVAQVAGSLGPLPHDDLSTTNWKKGLKLLIDPGGTPIKAADVTAGSVFHVMPEGFVGPEVEHGDNAIPVEELMVAKAKDAVILMRMNPEIITSAKERDWGYQGIVAYSQVCTHVGCPVALYEQQTHHLLCPCHQSTFDVTNDCEVIFGPAKRPLPQLPITVDEQGYLVARAGFDQPIGPSFFERG